LGTGEPTACAPAGTRIANGPLAILLYREVIPMRALFFFALSMSLSTAAFAADDDEILVAPSEGGSVFDNDESLASGDDEDLLADDSLQRGGVQTTDDKKKKAAPAPAPAIGEDEPDEDLGLGIEEDEPDESVLGDVEGGLEDGPAVAPTVRGPGPIDLDVAGKVPLADNYALSVVAVDRDAVVIELPVLIASSRTSITTGFQLIGEVYVAGTKVGEVRQVVMPASLAEFGPSFAFLKVSAPVAEKAGEIKVVVKQAAIDGSGAKDLFTRVTPYSLR
jgi:hypothetical protein